MGSVAIEQLQILLVEPSSAQHRIIEGYLRQLRVEHIHWVQEAQHALDYIAEQQPDLLISAMHLSDMTGTDLLETLRNGQQHADIPFMLISSETNYKYLEPIRQAGAIAILPKPFELEQLRTGLYATLDYFDPGQLDTKSIIYYELKVLLVDDSGLSRRHIANILRSMGIENITEAENGQQAFELVLSNFYDLIVTDLNMPEMDGKELIEQIRQNSQQANVPILMVSSERDKSRLAVVQSAGVSAICDKPFEAKNIKQIIERILN